MDAKRLGIPMSGSVVSRTTKSLPDAASCLIDVRHLKPIGLFPRKR